MSLFITKISMRMQTVTETADILFPVYDLLHIHIFYRIYTFIYTLDSMAKWIPQWPHKLKGQDPHIRGFCIITSLIGYHS